MIAIGMLIQKIERQVHSVRYPPAIGPTEVRAPVIPKKIARARPRFSIGKEEIVIARAAGNMIAAPAPWIRRKTMIQVSAMSTSGVAPQRAEADREDQDADHEHRLAPEHVRQLSAESEKRSHRKQIAADDPLDTGLGKPEMLLDLGDRDRDDRLVDESHRHGEDHRCQDEGTALLFSHC